jgi:hypothetical protein
MVMNPDLTNGASQERGGPMAADLVTRARNGDKQAWDALDDLFQGVSSGHRRSASA